MPSDAFDFLAYGRAIEDMIAHWKTLSHTVLRQSSDLGSVREHFIRHVLENFLPKTVVVGQGEIVDSTGKRSGQQDIIIYRANFPVITLGAPISTYLTEGVIAVIEVKSDISSGSPSELESACGRLWRVQQLSKVGVVSRGPRAEVERLQILANVKKYVVGYSGWKTKESLLGRFTAAGNSVDWNMPELICQPGFCLVQNDGFLPFGIDRQRYEWVIHEGASFSILLHHLLKLIMMNTAGSLLEAPGINATIHYETGPYFNFGEGIWFTGIELERIDTALRDTPAKAPPSPKPTAKRRVKRRR